MSGWLEELETKIAEDATPDAKASALAVIEDRRLYRLKYKSFADYCKRRWKLPVKDGEKLIADAWVANSQPAVTPTVAPADDEVRCNMTDYKIHPVAAIFPMIPADSPDYRDMRASVKEFGQQEPIVVDGDVLLDGRNRLAVCKELGIEPKVIRWEDVGATTDQANWIFAKNANRRQLTPDQTTMVYTQFNIYESEHAAEQNKARNSREGRRDDRGRLVQQNPVAQEKDRNKTRNAIAKAAKVSTAKAEQAIAVAKAVRAGTLPAEVLEEVKAGTLALKDAVKRVPKRRTLAKRKPKTEAPPPPAPPAPADSPAPDSPPAAAGDSPIKDLVRMYDIQFEETMQIVRGWPREYRQRLADWLASLSDS